MLCDRGELAGGLELAGDQSETKTKDFFFTPKFVDHFSYDRMPNYSHSTWIYFSFTLVLGQFHLHSNFFHDFTHYSLNHMLRTYWLISHLKVIFPPWVADHSFK